MMNLLLIFTFLLAVTTTSYLLHRYHLSERQRARKSSLPLPPIGSYDSNLDPQVTDINNNKLSYEAQSSINWLQLVSEKRKEGQTESALNLCRRKFPLYSAFRQAILILRSVLQNKSVSPEKTQETLLCLYKTAATAELIHKKSSDEDSISPAQMNKLNLTLIENFSFDYNKLGYTEIPLLTKKDVKALVSHWGEPKTHYSPHELYQKYLN